MQTFTQTLDYEFLQARYLLLEVAGILDRLDEAAIHDGGGVREDVRLARIKQAIGQIDAPANQPDRVERILQIFSEP